jgi:hypothetical protein
MLSYVPGGIALQVALVAIAVGSTANPSVAAKITACTQLAICYCVNDDLKDVIEAKVARFREVLATERKAGKAIGYMSVPLSTIGGGFFNVNMEVAAAAKRHIEKRFGDGQVWILNPGVPEANIPNGSGADYMLMWTQLLEGKEGLGEDFDFVYFVGPRTLPATWPRRQCGHAEDRTVLRQTPGKRSRSEKGGRQGADAVRLPQLLRAQGVRDLQQGCSR